VSNGTLSSFAAASSTVYTATFTPTAAGATTIDVAGGAFTDGAGNANTAATQFNWTFDTTYPTLAITAAEVSNGDTSNNATLALIFTASKATSNFVVGDITVSNGTLSSFVAASPTVYIAILTPATDGATTIDVAGGAFTDGASNANTAATQFNWTFDSTAPTLSSVSIASNNATTTTANIDDVVTLTLTASEVIRTPVVTFLSGGAAIKDTSVTYAKASGNTWTAAYTVNKDDTFGVGQVTYSIAFIDAANNTGTAVTNGTGSVTMPAVTVPDFSSSDDGIGSATKAANTQSSYSVYDGGIPVAVILRDGNNAQLTDTSLISSVTVSIVSGEGTLSTNPTGTTITIPNDGDAVFSFEIISTTGGVVSVSATVVTTNGVKHILPNNLDVAFVENAASATGKINIVTQPALGGTTAVLNGDLLSTQPVVRLLDNNGALKSSDSSTEVTARIVSGADGSLNANGPATKVQVVNGIATFTGLKLTGNANQAYRLVFMATNYVPAISQEMSLTPNEVFTAVKTDIKDKLASNAQTQLNALSTNISSIMSSARSRFVNKDTGRSQDGKNTDLSGRVSTGGSSLNGTTQRNFISADSKATKILEAQFSYTKTKEGLKSQSASGHILWEQQLSDFLSVGRFLGVSVGDANTVATNKIDIDFKGVQVGTYLVGSFKDSLIFDTYVAGSIIENKVGITSGAMTASSTYLSKIITSGASITGKMDIEPFEIRPTLSADISHVFGQAADFNVAVGTATSIQQISYDEISKGQITFAPETRLPIRLGGKYWDKASVIALTPNVKCRYFKQSTNLNECGQGLALRFNVTTKDGLKSLSAKAGLDRIGSETTTTLKLMFHSMF
jgi:hypothetical protein